MRVTEAIISQDSMNFSSLQLKAVALRPHHKALHSNQGALLSPAPRCPCVCCCEPKAARGSWGGSHSPPPPSLPAAPPAVSLGATSLPLPCLGLFCKQRDRMRRKRARNGSMSPLGRIAGYF